MRQLPAFPDLRSFLGWCRGRGDLLRIPDPVSVAQRMTAVQLQSLQENGPVLQFDNPVLPDGAAARMPLISNLFATQDRVAAGLGLRRDQVTRFGEFMADLRHQGPVDSLRDAMSRAPVLTAALRSRPRVVRAAPCQQVVAPPALTRLPVQIPWPGDAGPLITWPVVVTRPHDSRPQDTGRYNLGVYRMQVLDDDRAIMRWLAHRGGAMHARSWAAAGQPMPVAVALGCDPATLLGAALPLPENVSELGFSGILRGCRTELVPARTVPLLVPAQAEIILEGWLDPDDTAHEGPFGDHTGYYNAAEPFPVLHLSAMTHRHDPLYLSTVTGRPPDEPSVIAEVFNDLALPMIRRQLPELRDLWLAPAACSYRLAVARIDKRYPGQARRVMMALWGMLPQFSYTKIIIVVDGDIDARNWDDVVWALATRMDPARDLMVIDRTPMDYLDFSSPREGLAGKLGIDATTKIGTETDRDWGEPMRLDPADVAFAEALLARRQP